MRMLTMDVEKVLSQDIVFAGDLIIMMYKRDSFYDQRFV